jgi:hypothetical protein
MSALLAIILLSPGPFTASPDMGWQRVGDWGCIATHEARAVMGDIVESPSGRIHLHRMSGAKTVTTFLLYPNTDGLVYVITADGEALSIELFISRRVRLKNVGGVVRAMRQQCGV